MVTLDEAHFEKARHAYDNFVPAGCEWCDIDALRAAITAYLTAARAEPVAWRWRMRPHEPWMWAAAEAITAALASAPQTEGE